MPTLAQSDAQIQRRIARITNRTERAILSNYRIALNDTRIGMSKLYERFSDEGSLTLAEMTKFDRLSKMEADIIDNLGPVFTENAVFTRSMATVTYEQSFYQYGWAVSQDVGVNLQWGLIPRDAVRAAVQNPIEGLTLTQRTQRQRRRSLQGINNAVRQGLIQGDSFPTMMGRVKGFLGEDARHAMTVVRTETTRVMALGQQASFEQAEELGVEMMKAWDATLDMVTRPVHGDLDGQKVAVGDSFDSALGPVDRPGAFGVAEQDINCRCRLTPIVADMEPELRRIRDEGVVPYKSYKEWVGDRPALKKKFETQLSKVTKVA